MSANPFIYSSSVLPDWLINRSHTADGSREEKRRRAEEACRCASCRRVCMSVYSKEQRQICTNTHLTEHQRAVCSSACKQQWGCSERCLRTPAQTRSNRQPEISITHTFQFKANDNFSLKFCSYPEWRCSDSACGSPGKGGRRKKSMG